jgi:AraC-like DNA-binding protein
MAACGDRRIQRVLDAVARDLTKRWTLADAAAIAGLESVYFSKLFRKTMGVTFPEWTARIRVAQAKNLLRILDMSITAIAGSVGYTDITTFDRAFRRREQMSPRQYRTLQRERE